MENSVIMKRNTDTPDGHSNLVINAALCDTRSVLESTLASYDSVTINAATIITNEASREKLHSHNVTMNAADIIDLMGDAELVMKNGAFTIAAGDGDCAGKRAVLVVNGSLTVEPGAEKAMERYVSIQVNGLVTYPRSMEPAMSAVKVNGASEVYPDGAVVLKRSFVVDRVFAMRARAQKYYAAKRVVMVDPRLDCAALAASGAGFITRSAVIAEGFLADALPMFADDTDFTAVPDGCAYIGDDAELSGALLRRYGDKLYVCGDLTVKSAEAPLLAKFAYLHVTGDVLLPESAVEEFAAMGGECGGELIVVRGALISGKAETKIDRAALERAGEGITAVNCAEVHLTEDIPPELIEERLRLVSCAEVCCSRAQRAAVEKVAKNVADISEEDIVSISGGFGEEDVRGEYHFCVDDPHKNKMISAASYTL